MIYLDETTFKILETLSLELGTEMSINQLTGKIGERHARAYYANTYNKLQRLAKDNIVTINRIGNTSIVKLNFDDYWIVDVLAQMEIQKKQASGNKADPAIRLLLPGIERACREEIPFVGSVCMVRPEKNQLLNRVELVVLAKATAADLSPVHEAMNSLQKTNPMRIDYLVLSDVEFLELISSDEVNPAREMLADRIVIFGQQNFWYVIQTATRRGTSIKVLRAETAPARVSEANLVYSMARFGYTEMGAKPSRGREICIEYTIAAMIAQGDVRRIEAVPVLLAKNKVNYDLLMFISRKFKLSERLLGLMEALAEIIPEKKELQYATNVMKRAAIVAEPADKKNILEKMRLYNAA